MMMATSNKRRALPKHDDYGGYSYDFVAKPPDKYHCSICTKVLRDPHLTECCGNEFCESCLTMWEKKSKDKTCPQCRATKFSHIVNKKSKREIDALKVHCNFRKQGCTWVGELAVIETHYKTCGYVECKCMLCSLNVMRMQLQNHREMECMYRMIECSHCHKNGAYCKIISFEHFAVCPGYLMCCPNRCGKDVKRSDVEDHREQCPLETITCPCCPFKVLRKDLEHHIAANSHQHLMGLMMSFKQTEMELTKQIRELRMFQTITESSLKHVAENVDELMKGCTPKQLPALRSIKTLVEGCTVQQLSPTHPSLTITMPNFSSYKKAVSSSNHKVWQSSPFYYNDGYKMRLSAWLVNEAPRSFSVGPLSGDQLHLEIQLLQGEFDDKLQWPCEDLCIKISIVHPPIPTQTRCSNPSSWYASKSGTLSTPMNRCLLFASAVMWQHTLLLSPRDIHKDNDSLVFNLEWSDSPRFTYTPGISFHSTSVRENRNSAPRVVLRVRKRPVRK